MTIEMKTQATLSRPETEAILEAVSDSRTAALTDGELEELSFAMTYLRAEYVKFSREAGRIGSQTESSFAPGDG